MKKQTITTALAALLLTACDNTTELRSFQEEERVALEITSNIGMAETTTTRASNVTWTSGDKIGVYATKTTDMTPVTGGSNVLYTASETKAATTSATVGFTANPPVYLPANGDAIDVYAYYPYSSEATTPTAIDINVSKQTQDGGASNLPNIDFMRAMNDKTTINGSTAITKANKSTELLFYHKLSKVVFTLEAGIGMKAADITGATPVTLTIGNLPTAANYNIYTDAIAITTASTDFTTITTHETEHGKTYEAILLPNTAAGGTNTPTVTNNAPAVRNCVLTLGTATYTFNIPADKSFNAGEQTNYELTVNATGLDITAAIQPWNSQASVGLTAQ